jgi:hypothetical protein
MKITKVAHVTENQIYQIPGEIYDEEHPEFDCYMPEYTGDFWIVDCLICDKNGNLHPNIQKGVPVYTEHMKRI